MKLSSKNILIFILVLVALLAAFKQIGPPQKEASEEIIYFEGPPNTSPTFPLDDEKSRYYITGDILHYSPPHSGITSKEIYISERSTVDYKNYEDKDLRIKGRFVEETENVQCIKAPCNPITVTKILIEEITILREYD